MVKEKLPFILLAAIALTIALPIRLNAIVTVTALVLAIALAVIEKKDLKVFSAPAFLLILAQGIVLALGFFHTSDQRQGLADLERYLYALALPIVVYACRSKLSTATNVVVAFAIGCGMLLLYGLVYVIFVVPADIRSSVFSSGHIWFTEYISIHPSYLTVYLIFIFFFITEYWRTHFSILNTTRKSVIVILLILIILAVLFLRSQIELLVFVLLIILYGLILFKKRAAMVTFILFSVGLLVYLADSSRKKTVIDEYGQNVSAALDQRWNVWGGALHAIADAPLFGAGTGGEQRKLNHMFEEMGYSSGAENAFNAHNQYLELWVRNGVIELVIFIALLFVLFRSALKQANYTFLLMLMLVSMSMIAESFLNVQKGIAFFYFFAAVFMFLPTTSHADDTRR